MMQEWVRILGVVCHFSLFYAIIFSDVDMTNLTPGCSANVGSEFQSTKTSSLPVATLFFHSRSKYLTGFVLRPGERTSSKTEVKNETRGTVRRAVTSRHCVEWSMPKSSGVNETLVIETALRLIKATTLSSYIIPTTHTYKYNNQARKSTVKRKRQGLH